jgi:hypothetical protein
MPTWTLDRENIPVKGVAELKPERTLDRDDEDVDIQTTPHTDNEADAGLVLDQQEAAIAAAAVLAARLERSQKCDHVTVQLEGDGSEEGYIQVHVETAKGPEGLEEQTTEAAAAAIAGDES